MNDEGDDSAYLLSFIRHDHGVDKGVQRGYPQYQRKGAGSMIARSEEPAPLQEIQNKQQNDSRRNYG